MANLEERIGQWRHELAESLGGPAEVLEELEGHLRDEVNRLVQTGQSPEQAFEAAAARLGSPQALAQEFARALPPASWLPVRLAWLGLLVWVGFLVGLLCSRGAADGHDVLLAVHVGAITLGYTITLLAGALSACYVLARPFGTPTLPQVQGLTRAMLYLTATALGLTILGVLLGGFWAQEKLGRFWGWDPKEIGAAMVVLWNVAMFVLLGRRLLGEHARLVLGLAGNAVVVSAWFGPAVLGLGLHSYGFAPSLLALGVFLLTQAALAGLSLVPSGWLRRRTAPR